MSVDLRDAGGCPPQVEKVLAQVFLVGSLSSGQAVHETSLVDVVLRAASGPLWLFKQVAWFVGSHLDGFVSKRMDRKLGRNPSGAHDDSAFSKALTIDGSTMSDHAVSRQLALYVNAAKTYFEFVFPVVVSVAVDGSRAGGHNSQNMIVVHHKNVAAWAPPAVLRLYSVTASPRRFL
eukprot:TRINITY_DN31960_c1_g1_i3.p1 TRINITY_DN31960_c1_g1~~TRINITY_DN31960_c1_g1_i3.p1  ORF type:complete len:177 (+),score=31.76 TRINITY_DN31960_c1_g1_i3:171-701(+)